MNTAPKPRMALKPGALAGVLADLGVSRAELARRMGFTPKTAYLVATGQAEPSARFAAALLSVSGKVFDDLFDLVDDAA